MQKQSYNFVKFSLIGSSLKLIRSIYNFNNNASYYGKLSISSFKQFLTNFSHFHYLNAHKYLITNILRPNRPGSNNKIHFLLRHLIAGFLREDLTIKSENSSRRFCKVQMDGT